MREVLAAFCRKVELVVNSDVTDLMKLEGLDGARALALVERGVGSIRQIASAEPAQLARILRQAVPFVS